MVLLKKLFLFTLILILSGCHHAFLLGSAATTVFLTEPRNVSVIRKDAWIRHQINRKLNHDLSTSKHAYIMATSYNQVVLLTGQTLDSTLRQRAAYYAQTTPGVKYVFNQITFSCPASAWQRMQDSLVTSLARGRLLLMSRLKFNHFKVLTEERTIFILGTASSEEAERAVQILRNTLGVKKVVKIIAKQSI